jgi:phospholipid transport system transporter-binding protein
MTASTTTAATSAVTGAGFALPQMVTVFEAAAVLARLEAALAAAPAGGAFVIDAEPLQRFDTSVVALLLQAQRLVRAQGLQLDLQGVPPRLSELARLYGVGELV